MRGQRKPSSHVRQKGSAGVFKRAIFHLSFSSPLHPISVHSSSFSWRRNGRYFNVARDPQVSMRRQSGTLDIYAWNNPEQYEAEYQCVASNMYGSAYSNKIRLRLYSKIRRGGWGRSSCLFSPSAHAPPMHNGLCVAAVIPSV